MNDLYIAIGGRKGLIKLANDRDITGSLVHYADMLKNTELPNETRIKIMMDEALAHYAQTPKFGDKVKAIVGMIRAWLRDHKFAKLAEFGETDLLNILRQGRQKLKTGDGGNDVALMMGDKKSDILFRKGGKEPDDYSSSVDNAQKKLFNSSAMATKNHPRTSAHTIKHCRFNTTRH